MFPGCPEHCNAEGTHGEYSRNIACRLEGISNFEFCVIFTTIVKSLSYLRGPTKKIQGRGLDLYVVGQVMVARDDLVFARSDEGKMFFCMLFQICIRNCPT